MEVWRHQRLRRRSAKVYCSGFHVKAMSKHASSARQPRARTVQTRASARGERRRSAAAGASSIWLHLLDWSAFSPGTAGKKLRKTAAGRGSLELSWNLPLDSLHSRHLAVATGDACGDFLSALGRLPTPPSLFLLPTCQGRRMNIQLLRARCALKGLALHTTG